MRIQFFAILLLSILISSCRNTAKLSSVDSRSIQNIDSLDSKFDSSLSSQTKVQSAGNFFYPSTHYLDQVVWGKVRNPRLQEEVIKSLKVIYDGRNYEPVWILQDRSEGLYPKFLKQILLAETHGLDKELYQFTDIQQRINKFESNLLSAEEVEKLELDLSKNYLIFTHHLLYGVERPVVPDEEGIWLVQDDRFERCLKLADFRSEEDVTEYYNLIRPKAFQYELMQDKLAVYRNLMSNSWKQIELVDQELLQKGDSGAVIPLVKQRLESLGLLFEDKTYMQDHLFDDRLVELISDLQNRYGLKEDGVIGTSTLKALNTTPTEIADKIMLNLERMRWTQVEENQRCLQVNIPSYELIEHTKTGDELRMKAIVGKKKATTPVFFDTLKYLVFSPTWVVPNSIKGEEMLPKLQRNPNYYADKNFKFYHGWSSAEKDRVDPQNIDWSQYDEDYFPFNAVQQSGAQNALGAVKFIMPNDMSIYLHDTPAESKFDYNDRAFSHGCVRLEQPAKLAYRLLQDQSKEWSRIDIREAMDQEEPQQVNLESPVPTIITYFTAFIDEYGALNLRDDIYDFDRVQLEELNKKMF